MNGPPTGSPVCQGSTPAPSPNTITNRSAVARSRAPPSASAMPPAQTTHWVPKRSSRLILGLAAGAGGAGAAAGGSGPDGVGGASIFASGGSEAAGSASGVGAETGLGAGASPAVPARRVSREASLNSSLLTCSRVPSVSTMLTMASTGMAMTTAMRSPSMSISLAGGQRGWPGRWRTSGGDCAMAAISASASGSVSLRKSAIAGCAPHEGGLSIPRLGFRGSWGEGGAHLGAAA